MGRFLALLCLVALLAPGLGCKDSTKPITYLCTAGSPCTGDNAVKDFGSAFNLKDGATYRALLTSDFVFRLQVDDILAGGPDTLTQPQEMAFADHFFNSGAGNENPPADRVVLNLTVQSVANDSRVGHDGWKKYTVSTLMTAHFPNGNDVSISSPAFLYVHESPLGSGVWKIAEWIDQPGATGAPKRGATVDANGVRGPAPARELTWGRLKMGYL